MSVRNREKHKDISSEVADATFEMEIEWQCQDRVVPAQYSFSWVGVLQSFKDEMVSLGFEEKEWLVSKKIPPRDNKPGYLLEEGRACIVEGKKGAEEFKFVASFLPRPDVKPSVWRITATGKEILMPIRLRFGWNSLARILKMVISNVMHSRPCEIDRAHTEFVHRLLLEEIRPLAFSQEIDFTKAVQQSREVFRSRLIFEG